MRNRLLGAGAFLALVIIAFFGASLIHRLDAKEAASLAQISSPSESSPESRSRTTVVLVPVDGDGAVQDQPPVTSAPAQQPGASNTPVNVDRTDATALPSEAYSIAARRARAERETRLNSGFVDPRTIVGGDDSGTTHRAPLQAISRVSRTQPVPLYQPVPPMQVYRETNARLILTVGSEGRVRDINIARSIPGEMPRLIAAVQNWRFRPATENGQPVTSTFAVDITVRPR
jgi:hypothetical protein